MTPNTEATIRPAKNYRRGSDHYRAKHTEADILRVKQMLASAARVTRLADGEAERIAKEVGLTVSGVRQIASGHRWGWLVAGNPE